MANPWLPSDNVAHDEWLLERFLEGAAEVALVWKDQDITYSELLRGVEDWIDRLKTVGVAQGDAVGIVGDYSPASIACSLALLVLRCMLVPMVRESRDQHEQFFAIAELDYVVRLDEADRSTIEPVGLRRNHPLLRKLRRANVAGLVLFTSGSSGDPKAILHGMPELLRKFRTPRNAYRTISFLLFDHIGGINTLFYTLANLGCIIIPEDRSAGRICRTIEQHRAELLPASPSFLNLMLLGRVYERYDLSSIRLVTYGTEVMPERTLESVSNVFRNARLQQTYGVTELGILRSKSKDNGSLYVKLGGEDYETKVKGGTLWIRSRSSMLGYLNAPSPFDPDGWFDTGDAVLKSGQYYRILGRESDVINVGGRKVHPAEVEKALADLAGVVDVAVRGEPNLILGSILVATVQVERSGVTATQLKRQIAAHCRGRLQPFMIPAKVEVTTESPVNYRFKKVRR